MPATSPVQLQTDNQVLPAGSQYEATASHNEATASQNEAAPSSNDATASHSEAAPSRDSNHTNTESSDTNPETCAEDVNTLRKLRLDYLERQHTGSDEATASLTSATSTKTSDPGLNKNAAAHLYIVGVRVYCLFFRTIVMSTRSSTNELSSFYPVDDGHHVAPSSIASQHAASSATPSGQQTTSSVTTSDQQATSSLTPSGQQTTSSATPSGQQATSSATPSSQRSTPPISADHIRVKLRYLNETQNVVHALPNETIGQFKRCVNFYRF